MKTWQLTLLTLLTAAIAQQARPLQAAECGDTNVIYNLFDQSIEEMLANGEGTLGPRRLVTDQTSHMISTTSRRMIQATASDLDQLNLVVEKMQGTPSGGETAFIVCKTDEAGKTTKLDEFKFPGGQSNQGKRINKSYSGLQNQRLSVRLQGLSAFGQARFRLDLQRPGGEGALWQPDKQAPVGPVKGFADLHVHQAASLAFSGGWYWGSHREGPLSERLPACHGDEHATFPAIGGLLAPHTHLTQGAPDFKQWPAWNDIKHQQVSAEWLKAAHDKGFNLMVASVVNNQWLSAALIASGNYDDKLSPSDMESAKRQILSLQQMDAASDWYTIVRDPWEARRAIARGELAVMLAVEVSDLMPPADGPWRQQLHDLYHMGVRSIQIAHQTNNRFSGAAYHRDIFQVLSQVKHRFDKQAEFASDPDGVHNAIGLSAEGYELLDEMIRLNMQIDLAHLPLKTQQQIYQHVAKKHKYYPLFNSHTRMDPLLRNQEKKFLKEFVTTPETLAYVRETGGVLGLRTGEDPMLAYQGTGKNPVIANNCDGSIKSWLQFYQYADDRGVNLAFASDFNGFITQMAPRFGPEACANAMDSQTRAEQAQAQGPRDINASEALQEFDEKGLAHVGLLPAVIEDMKRLGADTQNIESSAERFLKMWERSYDPNRKPINWQG